MDVNVKKRGCLIPTVIIIVAIVIGFSYFYRYFLAVSSIVGIIALVALPYLIFDNEKNGLVYFVIKDRINEYYNRIYGLSNSIDNDHVKENIEYIEEGLGDLRHSLESKVDFYFDIIEKDEEIYARQKTKKQ
ncbi:MAG: hypothetical protein ACTSQG_09890 [Promethearchaeota archaeon]